MPKQILLVDDSVTIQRVVELTFAHEDYKVVAAKSADEGLAKARELKPDIVLADAGMPGKSGYDLCSALRSEASLAGTPCLILAGNFSPYDEGRGQKSGADGFVVKPFETQALIDKVADAIAKKGSAPRAAATATASPSAPTPVPPTLPSPPIASIAPARRDDSVEISIDRGDKPTAPPAAARPPSMPAPMAAPPRPPAAPPTAAPTARTMMGIPAPTAPPRPVMTPEPLGKPLSMVAPDSPAVRPPSLVPPLAPPPVVTAPPPAPAPRAAAPTMPASVPQMPRATLIPNVPTPSPAPPAGRTSAPPPRATLMGIPTVNPANLPPGAVALPATMNKPAAPWAPPATQPSMPAVSPQGHAVAPSPVSQAHAPMVSAVAERVVGEIAARGPEYEAVAQASREMIERIAWEIIPELAETIIKEQLDRLVAERQK